MAAATNASQIVSTSVGVVRGFVSGHCQLARGTETRLSRLRSHSSWRGAAADGAMGDGEADRVQGHQGADAP
jgi:hypothetical protein